MACAFAFAMSWLRCRAFERTWIAVRKMSKKSGERSDRSLGREDGQECKSDVRVLLHFGRSKTAFSSRDMQVFDSGDVRVLLQRKKICGARQVQQKRGRVNKLPDNKLRSKSANVCCTCVAMQRQSVCEVVRFSRAPRRFFRPHRYRIATRKNFCVNARLFWLCWGHMGIPQHKNKKFLRSVTVQEVLQEAKMRESGSAKQRRNDVGVLRRYFGGKGRYFSGTTWVTRRGTSEYSDIDFLFCAHVKAKCGGVNRCEINESCNSGVTETLHGADEKTWFSSSATQCL